MNRKLGIVSLLGILALALAMNVAVATDVHARTAAVASDTPCTDQWAGCIAGGGSEAFCHGMWCACMYNTYGHICTAQNY